MKVILKDIAEIRAGHPFRGAINESLDGNGYVIQIRDQGEEGLLDWNSLVATEVTGRKTPEWLLPDDIIFSARGLKHIASVIQSEDLANKPLPVVCAPHYFQIRIYDQVRILPKFLAWQLNQVVAQRYFQQSAAGSAQLSIRRGVLENTPIMLPSLAQQKHVVSFAECVHREKIIYEKLIELRRLEMEEISNQVLNRSDN